MTGPARASASFADVGYDEVNRAFAFADEGKAIRISLRKGPAS